MAENLLKKGSRGDEVRALQGRLAKLGYDVAADGIYGDATEHAVKSLQTSFGYNVDGIVGPATQSLISQQMALNWNAKKPATAVAQAGNGSPGKGDAGRKV